MVSNNLCRVGHLLLRLVESIAELAGVYSGLGHIISDACGLGRAGIGAGDNVVCNAVDCVGSAQRTTVSFIARADNGPDCNLVADSGMFLYCGFEDNRGRLCGVFFVADLSCTSRSDCRADSEGYG